MVTLYVRGIYLPGFELMPSLAMVALGAAFAANRNRDEELAEDLPLTPLSAPGL